MKRLSIFLSVFTIICLFSISNVKGQAMVMMGDDAVIDLAGDIVMGDYVLVISPNGNLTYNVTFHDIPSTNPFHPDTGINIITVWTIDTYMGVQLFDYNAIITSNGTLKVVLHYNGSGGSTPNN